MVLNTCAIFKQPSIKGNIYFIFFYRSSMDVWDLKLRGILFLSCLSFCPLWNFNLATCNNFWTVSARALIFHTSIPCDKTFPWVPVLLFLTLWQWPWSLAYFRKTLTLLLIFENWVLELWYFTWVFFVTRPFLGYQHFLPCDLDLRVWPIFWKL